MEIYEEGIKINIIIGIAITFMGVGILMWIAGIIIRTFGDLKPKRRKRFGRFEIHDKGLFSTIKDFFEDMNIEPMQIITGLIGLGVVVMVGVVVIGSTQDALQEAQVEYDNINLVPIEEVELPEEEEYDTVLQHGLQDAPIGGQYATIQDNTTEFNYEDDTTEFNYEDEMDDLSDGWDSLYDIDDTDADIDMNLEDI